MEGKKSIVGMDRKHESGVLENPVVYVTAMQEHGQREPLEDSAESLHLRSV